MTVVNDQAEASAGTPAMSLTSVEVRDQLESLLERDLLGPWDGPEEELAPGTSPAERYLLGRLVPHAPQPGVRPDDNVADSAPETVDREIVGVDHDDEDDVEPEATVRAGSMAASSLGLSFSVGAAIDVITVTASWGRYERRPSETQQTEHGRPRTVWHRVPAGGTVEVRLDTDETGTEVPDPEQDGVVVRYTVRHKGSRRVVDLALVNAQAHPPSTPDTARLYQAGLAVTALDGASAIFVGHNDPDLGDRPTVTDDERLHLELLHRHHREYAHGRQCAVDAFVRDGDIRAWKLATTSFPSAEVPLVVPGEWMPGLVLDMARLGSPELARDELVRALRPLVRGYRTWLDEQEQRLTSDSEVASYSPAGEHALAQARAMADRLDRAVDLLRDNGLAREAFRFANQAMALQRVRGELVRARLTDPSARVADLLPRLDVPANRSCCSSPPAAARRRLISA